MARTTVNIDDPVLRELKRLQKRDGRPLGRVMSDLLSRALAEERQPKRAVPFRWSTKAMGQPRVDLLDKDAVWAVLDDRG